MRRAEHAAFLKSSQTVVASYISDAFGNSVGGSGSSSNPLIWNGGSGYYSDAESGLQKVGARFYDPAVGRWISQDTLLVAGSPADSQALNRYCYCESNPILGTDRSGHQIALSPGARAQLNIGHDEYNRGAEDLALAGGLFAGAVAAAAAALLMGFLAAAAVTNPLTGVTMEPFWWKAAAFFATLAASMLAGAIALKIAGDNLEIQGEKDIAAALATSDKSTASPANVATG